MMAISHSSLVNSRKPFALLFRQSLTAAIKGNCAGKKINQYNDEQDNSE